MEAPSSKMVFNKNSIVAILRRENNFIMELFKVLPVPVVSNLDDDVLLEDSHDTDEKKFPPQIPNKTKTTRAKSLVELQRRLDEISARKKLNYREKLAKKNLKSKIKRKGKQGERNAAQKQERVKREAADDTEIKIDNSDVVPASSEAVYEKVVFPKFDFSGLGKKKHKKEKQDPQKMLEDLQKTKQKLDELTAVGELEKAAEIKEKSAWKNALAKAQGDKVKDDAGLLTKSIKKREQKLKQSRKKWGARQENVKKLQDDRQKKRQENIDKKKKTKKVNKMKKAVKKGKVIPGF